MLMERKCILRTRKDHECYSCGQVIPKGSSCRREVHLYPRLTRQYRFRVLYFCRLCYFLHILLTFFGLGKKKEKELLGPSSHH